MALDARTYYRTIKGYHEIAESSHERPMIDAGLLRRFLSYSGVIVDVGGGTGYNAEFLSLAPDAYICVDLSTEGIKYVQNHGRGHAVVADAAALPFRDLKVDTVLCSWSLEHFSHPEVVLDEMLRVLRPGGRIFIWGPNWDNIFRKDFPQFVHKSRIFIETIRLRLFGRMILNEIFRDRYTPFVSMDVAAFFDPMRYISYDTDAVHCVLCQETVHYFSSHGFKTIFLADFRDMLWFIKTSFFSRLLRSLLRPVVPSVRRIPFFRWFVIRFPLIVEKQK
ncbi:MAG: class I SAM-dependent methyltransferase [Bacteroidota bacterium]